MAGLGFYIGNHVDPRHKGKHPELSDKVIVPDVLVEAHAATLNLCFYTGDQFPAEYKGDIFAAFPRFVEPEETYWLQSCSRPVRPFHGKPRGEYEDFVTGFCHTQRKTFGGAPSESPSPKTAASYSARRKRHDLASELRQVSSTKRAIIPLAISPPSSRCI